MNKTYEYELSVYDFEKFQKNIEGIIRIVSSQKFKEYLGERLNEALRFIQRELLTTVNTELQEEMSNYMNSNHLEIEGDTIYIYNDAQIDIASKNMKETTKANYPSQLSLAKIVEYGIGYTGSINTPTAQKDEDWQYDVNNHGYSGWYYINDNGDAVWTNGYAGRLIFYHLKEFVEKSISTWISDYLKKEI